MSNLISGSDGLGTEPTDMPSDRFGGHAALRVIGAFVLAACLATVAAACASPTARRGAVATRPVATATPALTPAAPPSVPANASIPAPPSTTAAVASLPTAQISPTGGTTLSPGGTSLGFTVTITNDTAADITDFTLVVSMGHCSCEHTPTGMMPAGTMQMWNTTVDQWQSIPYLSEGTGMDFLSGRLVPPFDFARGTSITYSLRVALNAVQPVPLFDGQASVDVTLETASTLHQISGSRLPVTVSVG